MASNEKDEIKLKQLQSRAIDNGVTSLKSLTKEDVRLLEPDVECHSAILSPNTGIFDSYQFQSTLEYQASESGVSYIYNCEVTGIQVWSSSHKSINKKSVYIHNSEPSFTVHTSQGSFDCDVLINATGLWSISMASKLQFNKDLFDLSDRYLQHLPSSCYFAKGNYFKLTSSVKPFHHLIYPVPADDIAGLGIHATIDLNGCVRFGPDIEWLKNKNDDYAFSPHEKMSFDYNVNENRKNDFIHAIQRYFPNISIYDIETDYSGIRPKLCGPNGSTTTSPTSTTSTTPISTDFQIMTKSEHGIPRLINILGIESPGLTSSLAMAEYICDKLLSNSKK